MDYKYICLEKYGYYEMANNNLCDEIFEEVKQAYTDAKIIKVGIHQYIVVNEEGKRILNNKLQKELQDYNENITALEYTIYELGLQEF